MFLNHKNIVSLILAVVTSVSFAQDIEDGNRLKVHFLDIGQGDSILIQTPNQRTILVDAGPGRNILEKFPEQTSFFLGNIDLLVLTHPDQDHLEGFMALLPRYKIGQTLIGKSKTDSPLFQEFIKKLEEQKIPFAIASPDKDWKLDEGVFLDILAVPEENKSSNNASVMSRLVFGKTSLLLTGDAEFEEENNLLQTDLDLNAQLLKVSHHGSRGASGENFLKVVRPQTAVVISGRNNRYGHPHQETIARLEQENITLLNTQDEGTITFVSDGEKWLRK